MIGQATVQLFARLRELHGAPTIALRLPEGSSVAELRRTIEIEWRGEMQSLALKSAVAVNGEYATDERIIGANDEIALIPPVSGG